MLARVTTTSAIAGFKMTEMKHITHLSQLFQEIIIYKLKSSLDCQLPTKCVMASVQETHGTV